MYRRLFSILAVIGQVVAQQYGCATPSCVFANARLRFGTGAESSVNAHGLFVQPFYYSQLTSEWYKLTYSNYPLDTAIGSGTTGPNWSGNNVVDIYSLTPSNSATDYSGYIADRVDGTVTTGHGIIVANRTLTVLGQNIVFQNTFSLGLNDSFVKIKSRVINIDATPIQNMRIWVGTRDDFVGLTDSNVKTRGNLASGSFVPVSAANQTSYAIMITNPTEGVLFYSETPGVMTSYQMCCSFSNAYNQNPLLLAPSTDNPTDGSYAAVLPIGNLLPGQSAAITWYYAAGVISSLSQVAQEVAAAQIIDSGGATASSTRTSIASFSPIRTFSAAVSHSGFATMSSTRSSVGTMTTQPSLSYTLSSVATSSVLPTNAPTESATATATATSTSTATFSPPVCNPQLHTIVVPSTSEPAALISITTTILILMATFTALSCCTCGLGLFMWWRNRKFTTCAYCENRGTKKEIQKHLEKCKKHLDLFSPKSAAAAPAETQVQQFKNTIKTAVTQPITTATPVKS